MTKLTLEGELQLLAKNRYRKELESGIYRIRHWGERRLLKSEPVQFYLEPLILQALGSYCLNLQCTPEIHTGKPINLVLLNS